MATTARSLPPVSIALAPTGGARAARIGAIGTRRLSAGTMYSVNREGFRTGAKSGWVAVPPFDAARSAQSEQERPRTQTCSHTP
jgi:hypothetical protein